MFFFFCDRMLWLVTILFFTFAAVENQATDRIVLVTRFMTQLGDLLERDDLRLFPVENQNSHQRKAEDEIWKTFDDDDDDDEGVLLRTLTAHIPCRWFLNISWITYFLDFT